MSSAPPVSELTAHIGFWLRMVSNHVSYGFAAKLAGMEVTVAEWCLMRSLYGKGSTAPSRLAEQMGMTRGAITKLADRLIGKSLISRKVSESDKRAQTLTLTDLGADLVPKLAVLADRNDAEFFEYLTDDEREILQNLLKRLANRNHMITIPVE